MYMKKLPFIVAMVLISYAAQAQTKIGLPAGAPAASAILDASNTGGGNKGFLAPQVVLTGTTTAAPVTSPANGLIVFNTTASGSGSTAVVVGYYYWNTTLTQWVNFNTSASALTTGNIYTNDGTLAGPRTVTMGTNTLNFSGARVGFSIAPASAIHINNNFNAGDTIIAPNSSNGVVTSAYTSFPAIMFGQGGGLTKGASIAAYDNGGYGGGLVFSTHTNGSDNWPLNVVQAMTITPTGNIGIGVGAPAAKLDVNGTARIAALASAAATDSIVTVNATTGILHKRTISDLINNSGVATNIYNGDGSLTGTRTVNMGTNTLNFTASTGPVNLNSTGNGAPLNVVSNTNAISRTTFSNSSTGTSNRQDIAIVSNNNGIYLGVDNSSAIFGTGSKGYIDNRTTGRTAFGINGNEYLTIGTTGNVGIGTATPSTKLDVAGAIRLESITPNTNGSSGSIPLTTSHFYMANANYVSPLTLPASPADGQIMIISSIAAFTASVNTTNTSMGAAYTLPTNSTISFIGTGGTWTPVSSTINSVASYFASGTTATFDIAGGASSTTQSNAFNSSVLINPSGSSTTVAVTFGTPASNTNYEIFFTTGGTLTTTYSVPMVTSKTATGFTITYTETSAAAQVLYTDYTVHMR